MKKKLAVGLLSVSLLVGGASAVFAATDTSKLADLKDLYKQMFQIQQQIVQEEAKTGVITTDQAKSMTDMINQRAKLHEEALNNGQGFGPGYGMGMRGGYGPAFNNGQPLTQEQIDAWEKAREDRIKAHQNALNNGTLTPGQGYGPGNGPGFGRRGPGMGLYGAQGTTN